MTTSDPINILMVDDQPAKLLSYEAILGDLGMNLIKATSPREALEHLLKKDIAIVLMDVSMPEIDGFELAAMIRQHPRYQKTAIIFISAVRLTELDRLRGYESGAVDYIPVPVIPEILRAKVSVFAELFSKTRELEALNLELEQRVQERTAELEANASQLRESEERFSIILQNTSAIIYLTDAEGHCVHVNRGFERLFGVTNDQARGQSIAALLPAEAASAWAESYARVVTERKTVESEEEFDDREGVRRTFSSVKTPLIDANGLPIGIVTVSTDITERKQAENERAELLRREHEARLIAENAIQVRDDFLSVAAHELKTPVTGLRATAQIIARKLQKGDIPAPQWLSDGLHVIDQQSERLTRLIGQLLDVSRLDQEKLGGERVATDLRAMAERVVAMFSARTTRHTLTISGDAEVVAVVDPIAIEQVLTNLLDNAIKYSPDGGPIDVEVRQVDADHVQFGVRDRGIGIPPEKRGEVFKRFYQAHANEHRSGLGLGLYISSQIADSHGGDIRVEFPEDGGAHFIVALPVNADTLAPMASA
ncbi:MAG TPA: ATP-binding protein [Ktedonobacterales bacterium]